MEQAKHAPTLSFRDVRIPIVFAVAKVLMHLMCLGRYGIFRDEFYYLACARHLDWGYVDHPPLSIAFLAVWTGLFGDSVVALRVPALVAGALIVFLTGVLVRELGGGRFAQATACLAVLIAPLFLAMSNFYSMNVFDQLCWVALAWVLVRFLNTGAGRYWIIFGLVAGVGLQNKISVAFFGFGVVMALLLTEHRKVFLKKEIWIGGLLAGLLFLPHVLWQVIHGAPTLEFMHNATTLKNTPMTPLQLFLGIILEMHPLNAAVWIAGLGYALFHPKGKQYRVLGLSFLVVFFTFGFTNGKVYYLSPIMPMLLALGAVAWEQGTRKFPRWRAALVAPMALSGLVFLPMSLPILSPDGFMNYQARLGMGPSQMERGEASALPQYFADRFGWEALAAFVAEQYGPLASEKDQPLTIMVGNYGEAGALEYYSDQFTLPRVVSGHNNYYLWGPGDFSDDSFLAYGIDREQLEATCESVEELGRFQHPYVMPYENNVPLYHCSGLKKPIAEIWPLAKRFI